MIKNIIFDLDGTLTDPYIGITNSVLHSLTYYDVPVPEREELKPFIGPPLYQSYMKHFGFDRKTAEEAVEHYREYYREKGKLENTLYSGIPELLKALKEHGFSVAMATSKPKVFAREIAEHFGILSYFDYLAGSTLDHALIEKADILEHLQEISGYESDESVMIGDTVFDISGAKARGMKSIAVTYGYGTRQDILSACPDYVCETVDGLSGLLLGLLGNAEPAADNAALAQTNGALLAYLGDAQFELSVRKHLTLKGGKVGALNKEADSIVSAKAQCAALNTLLPLLTKEEHDAFRRGKNIHVGSCPKSCSLLEYRKATGFEAVFGYLCLKGDTARIDELVSALLKQKACTL